MRAQEETSQAQALPEYATRLRRRRIQNSSGISGQPPLIPSLRLQEASSLTPGLESESVFRGRITPRRRRVPSSAQPNTSSSGLQINSDPAPGLELVGNQREGLAVRPVRAVSSQQEPARLPFLQSAGLNSRLESEDVSRARITSSLPESVAPAENDQVLPSVSKKKRFKKKKRSIETQTTPREIRLPSLNRSTQVTPRNNLSQNIGTSPVTGLFDLNNPSFENPIESTSISEATPIQELRECAVCLEAKSEDELINPYSCSTISHGICRQCFEEGLRVNPNSLAQCPTCRAEPIPEYSAQLRRRPEESPAELFAFRADEMRSVDPNRLDYGPINDELYSLIRERQSVQMRLSSKRISLIEARAHMRLFNEAISIQHRNYFLERTNRLEAEIMDLESKERILSYRIELLIGRRQH